jgi:hypothetical protein
MKAVEKNVTAILSHNTGIGVIPPTINNIVTPTRNKDIFDDTILSCVNAKNVIVYN